MNILALSLTRFFLNVQFILPYLIGWYAFADSIKPEDSNRANSSNTRTVDHEWSR